MSDEEVNPWDLIGDPGAFLVHMKACADRIDALLEHGFNPQEMADAMGLTREAWARSSLGSLGPPPSDHVLGYMMARAHGSYLLMRAHRDGCDCGLHLTERLSSLRPGSPRLDEPDAFPPDAFPPEPPQQLRHGSAVALEGTWNGRGVMQPYRVRRVLYLAGERVRGDPPLHDGLTLDEGFIRALEVAGELGRVRLCTATAYDPTVIEIWKP